MLTSLEKAAIIASPGGVPKAAFYLVGGFGVTDRLQSG
jgi:hypothetical protein